MNLFIHKILIVDDLATVHEDFRRILSLKKENKAYEQIKTDIFGVSVETPEESLENLNYQIDSAFNGPQAIELVKQAAAEHVPYSLVFMDIHMPDMDGIQTIKQLWQLDSEIQIVICTAFSDYSWEDMASQLGNSDNFLILKKPFDPIEIRQLVLSLVKKWELMKQVKQHMGLLESTVEERTRELAQSYSLIQAVLDTIKEAILVIDENKKVIIHNQAFLDLWQVSKDLLELTNFNLIAQQLAISVKSPDAFRHALYQFSEQPKLGNAGNIEMENGDILMFFVHPLMVREEIKGCVFSFLKCESIACQPQ